MSSYRLVLGWRWECLQMRQHWRLQVPGVKVDLIHYTSPFSGQETGWYLKIDGSPGLFRGNRLKAALLEVTEDVIKS